MSNVEVLDIHDDCGKRRAHKTVCNWALFFSYVRDFSLRFTPEEHIESVFFAYSVVVEPDIEAVVIDKAIELLNEIIEFVIHFS